MNAPWTTCRVFMPIATLLHLLQSTFPRHRLSSPPPHPSHILHLVPLTPTSHVEHCRGVRQLTSHIQSKSRAENRTLRRAEGSRNELQMQHIAPRRQTNATLKHKLAAFMSLAAHIIRSYNCPLHFHLTISRLLFETERGKAFL